MDGDETEAGRLTLSRDLLMGAKAAAEFTGLPKRTIYHLTETGRIPSTKLGRTVFYRKSELTKVFSCQPKDAP